MKSKRNRTVEIYFVLYLAAIIFLLPDKIPNPNVNGADVTVLEGPFRLQPVKTSLACRYYIDSSGTHILSIDSMNTIIFYGDVEDVNYNFEVEDLALRQRQVLTKGSKYFHFEEDIQKKELTFYWIPPLEERGNKTYTIKVRASAREKSNKNNNEKRNFIYEDETQFSLLMIDVTEQMAANIYGKPIPVINNITNNGLLNNGYPGFLNNLDINIEPMQNEVKALAYQNWVNRVLVWGANAKNELIGKPEIKVSLLPQDNNGTAQITGIGENEIIISGRTPSYGKMKVMVTTKFRQKNLSKSVEFFVQPIMIGKPNFASTMYPDKQYLIETNLPYETGWETEVLIIEKDKKKELVKSNQGENLIFKPDIYLIGKGLSLERWINGNKYDSYDLKVDDYPNPVIFDIFGENPNEITITTRSFGSFNGKKNEVTLDLNGNISFVMELRGMYKSEDITISQAFKCKRKNLDKPFEFDVTAVDKRGKESPTKKYPR